MKSNTKNYLTDSQIKKLAEKHFGKDCGVTDITELKGGQFNAAYMMRRGKNRIKLY